MRFFIALLSITIAPLLLSSCSAAELPASSSSVQVVSSSQESDASDDFLSGYLRGMDSGSSDGFSNGFDLGESNGESIESIPFDDYTNPSFDTGYEQGYQQYYIHNWLSGYLSGYLSQHPEINEYDLLDIVIGSFPDAKISDMIDYLRTCQ